MQDSLQPWEGRFVDLSIYLPLHLFVSLLLHPCLSIYWSSCASVTPCAALSIGGLLIYILPVDTEIIEYLRFFIVRDLKIFMFSLAKEVQCNIYQMKDKTLNTRGLFNLVTKANAF